MVMDIQEYAKQKGIPVGAIPPHAFRKAQTMDAFAIRNMDKNSSKAEAFKKLCFDTKKLVENCTNQNKVSRMPHNSSNTRNTKRHCHSQTNIVVLFIAFLSTSDW
jgi:hypothetical protein